jgi:hypothetical protein
MTGAFVDELVAPGSTGLPERFFDRFVFNLHPTDSRELCVLFGLGLYPPVDTVDGFAIVVSGDRQRNLRFSTLLSATDPGTATAFSWQVVEPMRTWHLALGSNPTGLEFDVTWHARTPAWFGEVAVGNAASATTSFEHLFQSGLYSGWLSLDGEKRDVTGWYGQRDRSRGVRTMSGGQGLHLWVQAQFPDRSVGALYVEDREHSRLLLEGAVMPVEGEIDPIVDLRHDLSFGGDLDLHGGILEIGTASGQTYRLDVDASGRGGYLAGGGYGGHHGRPAGLDQVESDVYPLDGSVAPATLDSALTDRLAAFAWGCVAGSGIFEFAHTRSRSYTYAPSL